MPSKTITQLYKQEVHSVLKSLGEVKDLDGKQIHDLRVGIKNWRVLLELLQVLSNNKIRAKKYVKRLSPVFKHAGKIREAALNIKLVQPYRSALLLRFKKHLNEQKKNAGKQFIKDLKNFDEKKFVKLHKNFLKEFETLKQNTIQKKTTEYLRVLFAKVRADLFDINDDKTLHEIRKKLKRINTTGALMRVINTQHPFKKELDKIKVTYKKIGQWHDTIMLVAALEKYVHRQGEDPQEIAEALILIQNLRNKCQEDKREIAKKLTADLV